MADNRQETSIEVRLRDPLSDITRKERRNLLVVSVVAAGIVHTGLVPQEITALGIKLSMAHQSALLKLLALVVGYFLAAFIIYAVSDWLSGRWALQLALEADHARFAEELERDSQAFMRAIHQSPEAAEAHNRRRDIANAIGNLAKKFAPATTPILMLRHAFEFAIPIGAGVYALLSLIKAW